MSKDAVTDWSATAADNTDVGGIDLGEGTMQVSAVNGALREIMAQISAGIAAGDFIGTLPYTVATASTPTYFDFAEDTDNGTHRVRLIAPASLSADVSVTLPSSTGTLALTSALTSYAKLDTEDQTLTGGARVTSKDLGTVTSGTVTLDPGDRPLQRLTNNGAFTLAPGSNEGSLQLLVVNGQNASTVTTSGYSKVVGAFTNNTGHEFICSSTVINGFSLLTIQALQ